MRVDLKDSMGSLYFGRRDNDNTTMKIELNSSVSFYILKNAKGKRQDESILSFKEDKVNI